MKDVMGRIFLASLGTALSTVCIYIFYWLIMMAFSGASTGNIAMVILSGFLLYILLGILVVGAIFGVAIIIVAITD